uniref:Chromosome 17 C22orf15 homolog n=2 Tax=Bos TaxID=9903 RepID=E1BIE3_BOVIN
MFIKVMFGASCWELVNTWCGLGTLTAHLRQSGQVPPDASVALLAEDGHLVSLAEGLEEGPSPAPSVASPPLLPVIRLPPSTEGEGGDPTRYECLLENPDGWHPELAGECHSHRRAWGQGHLPTRTLRQGFPGLTEEPRWRRACSLRATAGGGAWALGVASRSKVPLHSPEGWAPCCPGPRSRGLEPGKEETRTPGGCSHPEMGPPSQGTDVCAERWTAMPASLRDTRKAT